MKTVTSVTRVIGHETGHTPGPWTLEAGRSFVTCHGRFHLAYGQDRDGNPEFRDYCALDANARLIAAAPELLAALTKIEHWVTNEAICSRMTVLDGHIRDVARAAIAQAEGRGE